MTAASTTANGVAAPGDGDLDLPGVDGARSGHDRSFERWGIATYLLVTLALVASVLVYLGKFIYVLDDPAIHLSMADRLVSNGTWGVVPGHFESASSSPLWTALVAAGLVLTPRSVEEWVPLVLNVVAGLAVVLVLARSQTALRPGAGRGRRLDAVATVALVAVALFLPGLALVGMEHSLHVLLVLAAVIAVHQRGDAAGSAGRVHLGWLPYALLALATLTRFESAFVAVGLAGGLALTDGDLRAGLADRWRAIAGVLAASALPTAAFALWNKAMGGGFLPNSVLAKGQGTGSRSGGSNGLGPSDISQRLTQDPLLALMVGVALIYLVVTWGRPARQRLVALTLVVASLFHAVLADMGWFERYQAYLLAIGVYFLLGVVAELPRAVQRRALVAAVTLVVTFGMVKVVLFAETPLAADDMYRQQYQAARFFERYYDGRPIATDQLGYISLLHDGPLTDLAGLGDYEVLRERPDNREDRPVYWQQLSEERGFEVVAVYDTIALTGAPEDWVLGGSLHIEGEPVTSVTPNLQIWSSTSAEADVEALLAHLDEFRDDLPDRMSLEINEWAGFQASARRDAATNAADLEAAAEADLAPAPAAGEQP
jgi:hypothetical protein